MSFDLSEVPFVSTKGSDIVILDLLSVHAGTYQFKVFLADGRDVVPFKFTLLIKDKPQPTITESVALGKP